MWERFTEQARRVVHFAQDEATRRCYSYVGSEHLLIGLLQDNDCVAVRLLHRMQIDPSRILSDLESQMNGTGRELGKALEARTKRVIWLAYDEARHLNTNYIGTEHLLLAVIREGEGNIAGRLLAATGVDLERTRQEWHDFHEENKDHLTSS